MKKTGYFSVFIFLFLISVFLFSACGDKNEGICESTEKETVSEAASEKNEETSSGESDGMTGTNEDETAESESETENTSPV